MTFKCDFQCHLQLIIGRSHFSENKIAIGLVESNTENIIFIITIIGTDKNIQTGHQITHQKTSPKIMTIGLKFNLFHKNFGSTIFHINWSNKTSKTIIIIESVNTIHG
ncbi:MAG: hypothetical protein LBQ24_01785 [Candidatus Peribacteria bacterium]|nr:hypothetical protein [Candidatus Peribacteria bacterium]